jgi:hypothetical protein
MGIRSEASCHTEKGLGRRFAIASGLDAGFHSRGDAGRAFFVVETGEQDHRDKQEGRGCMNPAYQAVIAASDDDRRGLFLANEPRRHTRSEHRKRFLGLLDPGCPISPIESCRTASIVQWRDIALESLWPAMFDALRQDYAAMATMIFGDVPSFGAVLESVGRVGMLLNAA